MIKSVYNYPVSTLLDIESGVVYAIPRYQRETGEVSISYYGRMIKPA